MLIKNNDQTTSTESDRKVGKIAATVASTLFLGAIGSGVWEVMFRPGLSTLGMFFSTMSVAFENDVYVSAALDPQPLPGLILLLLLCSAPLIFCFLFVFKGFLQRPLDNFLDSRLESKLSIAQSSNDKRKIILRLHRVICIAGILVSLFFGTVTFMGFALQNEATRVWRIFNANLDICSAISSDSDIKRVRAHFRSMRGKADYEQVRNELDQLATSGKVSLNWYLR